MPQKKRLRRLLTSRFNISACLLAFAAGATYFANVARSQPPGGGPNAPDQMIVEKFDVDKDGILNTVERQAARTMLEQESGGGQRRRGPGRRGQMEPGKPGQKVSIDQADTFPDAELYDQSVVRTFFLQFENEDWEKELATFKPTDVEVPAMMTVDGKQYPNVGVSFRGASSFFMIPEGLKRSLNLSIDFVDEDQKLYGYKSLNLLNCNGDPSMMSSILYSHVSRQKIAAPKVNYVKVVINGENWGLYVSSQQFNKTFLKENYDSKKGARWKVHGSPRGDGGLRYTGEDVEDYEERFEIKSKDKESSWKDLINLCRVLNKTDANQLEEKLSPILDIEGALWFLAVDVATVNSDGYWTRASDYNIYQNADGKFHILPHDMNEAFKAGGHGGGGPGGPGRRRGGGPPGFGGPGGGREGGPGRGRDDGPGGRPGFGPPAGGGQSEQRGERGPGGPPGGFGGPGGGGPGGGGAAHGGIDLEPLVGLDEERMPLRSVLLKNPKWRTQYLQNVREIATMMAWDNMKPMVTKYRQLIEGEAAKDTRKLFTTKAFREATSNAKPTADSTSLRSFLEKRSAFLLNHKDIKSLQD